MQGVAFFVFSTSPTDFHGVALFLLEIHCDDIVNYDFLPGWHRGEVVSTERGQLGLFVEFGCSPCTRYAAVVVCDSAYFGIDPISRKYGPVSPIPMLFNK